MVHWNIYIYIPTQPSLPHAHITFNSPTFSLGLYCEQSTWNPSNHVTRMDKRPLFGLLGGVGSSEVRQSPIKIRSLSTPRLETLCAYHQCQNKASCVESHSEMYSCSCREGQLSLFESQCIGRMVSSLSELWCVSPLTISHNWFDTISSSRVWNCDVTQGHVSLTSKIEARWYFRFTK